MLLRDSSPWPWSAAGRLARWQQSVLLAIEESETALVRYARERETRRSLAEAADASRRAVELAEVLYSRGLSDYLVVLDAQRTLNDVEDRLAVSETAVATGLVRIYKALGGGWEVFEPSKAWKASIGHLSALDDLRGRR